MTQGSCRLATTHLLESDVTRVLFKFPGESTNFLGVDLPQADIDTALAASAPYGMDLPPAWFQTCACGRTFSLPQAYTYHKRGCQRTKKRLSGALERAREVWQAKKRQKTEKHASDVLASTNLDVISEPVTNEFPEFPTQPAAPTVGFHFNIVPCSMY
jgi:hypothetical protein